MVMLFEEAFSDVLGFRGCTSFKDKAKHLIVGCYVMEVTVLRIVCLFYIFRDFWVRQWFLAFGHELLEDVHNFQFLFLKAVLRRIPPSRFAFSSIRLRSWLQLCTFTSVVLTDVVFLCCLGGASFVLDLSVFLARRRSLPLLLSL